MEEKINLQRIVLDTIRGIEAERKRENRWPHHVMLIADNPFKNVENLCSRSEFNDILKELEDWGVIRIGRTINDTWISEVELADVDSKL